MSMKGGSLPVQGGSTSPLTQSSMLLYRARMHVTSPISTMLLRVLAGQMHGGNKLRCLNDAQVILLGGLVRTKRIPTHTAMTPFVGPPHFHPGWRGLPS